MNMNYHFSDRVKSLNPSAIREILKYAAIPGVISLSAGNPAPEAFPIEKIAEISAKILAEQPIDALQYSTTEGYGPFRARIMQYMKSKYNVGGESDEVLITGGAQQVMELVVKVMCNPGEAVICESPSFVGSLNSFRSIGGRLVGVPIESDGIDITALESALKSNPDARFLYTIPNFQNPSGVTMSMEKRRAVYALARKYDIVILEDNPYGDLRYEGGDIAAIKTLDEDGRVIYAGSFSKVVAPGLRVGYAIGPAPLIQKMVVCKQGEDVHTAMWSQLVCNEFLAWDGYENHLQNLRTIYSHKAHLMISLMEEHLVPHGITYERAQGGLFLWCKLPEGADMSRFCTEAVREHKVAIVPGDTFLPDPSVPCRNFRLNFSTPSDDDMREGMARLGIFAKEFLKK